MKKQRNGKIGTYSFAEECYAKSYIWEHGDGITLMPFTQRPPKSIHFRFIAKRVIIMRMCVYVCIYVGMYVRVEAHMHMYIYVYACLCFRSFV